MGNFNSIDKFTAFLIDVLSTILMFMILAIPVMLVWNTYVTRLADVLNQVDYPTTFWCMIFARIVLSSAIAVNVSVPAPQAKEEKNSNE